MWTAACCIKSIGEILEGEECVDKSFVTIFHIDFLRATVPSDHKSAFIESLVPGSTL